jgi:subtilisin family serine protease
VTLAVLGEWGWPLLGGVRTGAAAVLLVSIGMCAVGNADAGQPTMHDPYVRTMAGIGVAILAAAVVALITGSEVSLLVETGLVLTMWVVSTVRHALAAGGSRPVPSH